MILFNIIERRLIKLSVTDGNIIYVYVKGQ